jgi:hypothetical protein
MIAGSTGSTTNGFPSSTSKPITFNFSAVGTGAATVAQSNFWVPAVTSTGHSITHRSSLSWSTSGSIYTGLTICSAQVGGFADHYMILSYLFLTFDNSIFS